MDDPVSIDPFFPIFFKGVNVMKLRTVGRLGVILASLFIAHVNAAPTSAAAAGNTGVSKPPSANMHAMILTIGNYREGIPPLRGVQYDAETATQIARKMGVMDSNIRVYRDDELTLDGIKKAFDDLEARVQQDDQVFIYYSGHGGRQLVKNADQSERCAESLISIDGTGFVDVELEARLKRLSQKAQKLVMLLDACHSGGVTTRALGEKSTEFTPKYFYAKGGLDACSKPVNVLTRSINANLKVPGSGANNYTYIAAARDNEISLDQPGKGGVASQAWLDCMNGAAIDTDGSGSLSADEIKACAQEKINLKLSKAKGVLPHHVSITGNPDMIIGFAEKSAAAAPAQGSATSTPAPAASPTTSAPAKPAAQPAAKLNPIATLKDIYNNRDDRRVVELKAAKQKLKIGQDAFEFTLKSSHEGHVYLLMVGSDGTSFDLLFPNQLDHSNKILAGETLKLPRASWELSAQGPVGKDTLLAIVAESPRDFSNIGMQPAGPFSSIDVKGNREGARDIQLVTGSSSNAGAGECLSAKTRNLAIQKKCSNAYGSALLVVEEVQ